MIRLYTGYLVASVAAPVLMLILLTANVTTTSLLSAPLAMIGIGMLMVAMRHCQYEMNFTFKCFLKAVGLAAVLVSILALLTVEFLRVGGFSQILGVSLQQYSLVDSVMALSIPMAIFSLLLATGFWNIALRRNTRFNTFVRMPRSRRPRLSPADLQRFASAHDKRQVANL